MRKKKNSLFKINMQNRAKDIRILVRIVKKIGIG